MNEHEHEQLSALVSALTERDALRTEVEHLRGTSIGKIVKERDALLREVESLKVPAPPPVPPGWGTEALSLGTILDRAYNESPKEAAERVVKQRDSLYEELEAIRSIVKADAKKSVLERVQKLYEGCNEALATTRAMARALGINAEVSLQQMLLGCETIREDAKQGRQKLIEAHERVALVLKERDLLQKRNDELSKSLEVAVRDRDALLSEREKAEGKRQPAHILELKGFRVGDLVRRPSKPYSKEHTPIEALGQGHGGYWYVYVRASKEEASGGGGWNPEDMTRKPIEDGDTVRFVGSQPKPSGPWRVKSIQNHSATVTCGDTLMSVPLSGLVAVSS